MSASASNLGGYHEKQNEQPPVIDFFLSKKEDRTETLKRGRLWEQDVFMVRVRQRGSKDFVEQEAEDFVKQMEEYSMSGRCPDHWGSKYREAFERFKRNESEVVEGDDVRTWPGISPAQVMNLRSMGIRSVQDVAQMNEAAMRSYGMGAQMLKDRASAYLETIQKRSGNPEQLAALRHENAARDEVIEDLRKTVASLQAKLGGQA